MDGEINKMKLEYAIKRIEKFTDVNGEKKDYLEFRYIDADQVQLCTTDDLGKTIQLKYWEDGTFFTHYYEIKDKLEYLKIDDKIIINTLPKNVII